ncbi:MAG: SEC-C metal-binding domain-containing protein [Thermoanaerobaculia bacterium]
MSSSPMGDMLRQHDAAFFRRQEQRLATPSAGLAKVPRHQGMHLTTRVVRPIRNATPAVGRNDPCPCASGKKFKKCCGKSVQPSAVSDPPEKK